MTQYTSIYACLGLTEGLDSFQNSRFSKKETTTTTITPYPAFSRNVVIELKIERK